MRSAARHHTDWHAFQDWSQSPLQWSILNLGEKESCGCRDVLCIPVEVLLVEDVGVGPEGLHQALGCTIAQQFRHGTLLGDVLPEIKELCLILLRVIKVGIVEERGEVILLSPEPKALEVDEP